MSLPFLASLVIRLAATIWTVVTMRRIRDWRLGFVSTAVFAVVVYQMYLVMRQDHWWVVTVAGKPSDVAWFGESVLTLLAVVFVMRVLTDNKTIARQLEEKEQQYMSLFDHNQDAVYTVDTKGCFRSSNPACRLVTGYDVDDLQNVKMSELVVPEYYETTLECFQKTLHGDPQHYEIAIYAKSGERIELDVKTVPIIVNGEVIGIYGLAKDITAKKAKEDQMRRMAFFDILTDLPNRMMFEEQLQKEIEQARVEGQKLAVMFMDLDRFKMINDTFGHGIGDRLLQAVAERLNSCVQRDHAFARISGDEFTLILPNIAEAEDAIHVAQHILDTLERPFMLEGNELFITTSIGISLYPCDGLDIESLVKNADTAMYRAKEQGRNNYQLYRTAMNEHIIHRVTMETDLRKALERGEFELYYQPQVNVRSRNLIGLEALVRWNHPTRGLVLPSEFIPLAEETGLIVPLGEWVLQTACQQVKHWQSNGFPNMRAAVNLSARQFQRDDLVGTVERVLKETGLDPKCLDLEITESVTMHNVDRAIITLNELKNLGIHISLDDFGTGYSSLSYLKHFPIHMLKIDRSFVRDITTDPDDAAIATSIIAMAHSLKLNVIAEGVETEDHLEYLLQQGCTEMQGYLFSPPLPVAKVEEWLDIIQRNQGV
ncbi:MAG: EAL domain-containing protein [Tumebacillaceae bacterium]